MLDTMRVSLGRYRPGEPRGSFTMSRRSGSVARARSASSGLSEPRRELSIRVQPRQGDSAGPAARVFLTGTGRDDVELTGCLTAAMAHCLWQARGGDDVDNWCQAERLLADLLGVKPPPRRSEQGEQASGPIPEPAAPLPVSVPRRVPIRK
jgi:hypothetical protein